MSAVANQNQLITVTMAWREPNGQVIQFGGGPGSVPAPAPVATSSGSSSFSGGGSQQRPAGSGAVDLFA
jgi:hypothetical protein